MQEQCNANGPFATIDLALLEHVDGGRRLPKPIRDGLQTAWDYTKWAGEKLWSAAKTAGSAFSIYKLGELGYEGLKKGINAISRQPGDPPPPNDSLFIGAP